MLETVVLNRQKFDASGSRDQDGFALVAVLFVLVVLTAVSIVSLRTTGDEMRAGRAMRESVRAFYAAEAGANAAIAAWDQAAYDTLLATPGDSSVSGWQTLDNGSSYRAVVRRVDGGSGSAVYSVTSTGRGVGGLWGQRALGVTLHTVWAPVSSVVTSAVRGGPPGNDIRLRENEFLTGHDTIPPQFAAQCSGPTQDVPGMTWGDTSQVRVDPRRGWTGIRP